MLFWEKNWCEAFLPYSALLVTIPKQSVLTCSFVLLHVSRINLNMWTSIIGLILCTFDVSTVESSNFLFGKHGSLHPKNQTNSDYNKHKLELFFDPDCVSTKEEAEVHIVKICFFFFFSLHFLSDRKIVGVANRSPSQPIRLAK